MKIITTTGFYGTGSSAITDLLSEYDNVCCKGDYEIRIAHDPYGISDLEYNLIENPNKNNSSNALKKFRKVMVERLHGNFFSHNYEDFFNNNFLAISESYIKELTLFEYYGRWHYDLIERGKLIFTLSRMYNKFFTICKRIVGIKNEVDHCILSKKEPAFGTILNEEKFINATRNYFDSLIYEMNVDKKEYVILDQLVPPTNIRRYERYFSSLFTIVVDRDPRDIYILEKYYWKGHTVPYYDIDLFCKWFAWTREQYETAPKGNSIKIQFEDLIFNYDESVAMIENFLHLDTKHHIRKESKLIIAESKKNIGLWDKYPAEKDNIDIIEDRLDKYCYRKKVIH